MEVILLEKMSLGPLGARVHVKSGYGRNYLIPLKKAVYATPENMAKFDIIRANCERLEAQKLEQALQKKAACQALSEVVILAKSGEEGKLFGSISAQHIAEALADLGIDVNKRMITVPQGGLRMLGQHEVNVTLAQGMVVTIQLHIVPME